MSTITGDYTTQDMRNLIFKFYPGTYTPQKFGDVTLNWMTRPVYSSIGNIQASINAVGGIRDLSAFIYGIYGVVIYSEEKDLSGRIDMHAPANLQAYLDVLSQDYGDLPSSIHGWIEKDLPAFTRAMQYQGLDAILNPIPPVDLPTYLKVWPMKALPSDIHGWDTGDLSAVVAVFQYSDLPIYIDMHPWVDLPVYPLRVWAREIEANLSVYTVGVAYTELPATIGVNYLDDISAYVFSIAPSDLGAYIHSWQETDLQASLIGAYGDYDLQAIINAVRNIKELSAYIKPMLGVEILRDLGVYVEGWRTKDISAYVSPIPFVTLSGYINSVGQIVDLSASIYPKTIRLSSVISVITMEHLDLSGVINPSCMWSEPRDLLAYIRCVYKDDLGATIVGRKYTLGVFNLSASVGFANSYSFIDRLPISVSVATQSYMFEDKFPIYLSIFREITNITSSIVGTLLYNDLPSSITGDYLELYSFENVTDRIKACNLNYMGVLQDYETVEISFRSIVEDYFYSSAGDSAWKSDRTDRWILELKSYVPGNVLLNTKRKLHKMRALYDLDSFESIDEAMKFTIEYVMTYPYDDISAYINSAGGYIDFPASIRARYIISTYGNLQSSVIGIADEIVVATTEGISIF